MNVFFSAAPFLASHGKNPSGRGSWAFSLQRNPANVLTDVVFAPSGTLTEAKAWARRWAIGEAARVSGGAAKHVVVFIQP